MRTGQGIPTSTHPKDVPFPTLQLDDAFLEADRLVPLRNLLTDSIVQAGTQGLDDGVHRVHVELELSGSARLYGLTSQLDKDRVAVTEEDIDTLLVFVSPPPVRHRVTYN